MQIGRSIRLLFLPGTWQVGGQRRADTLEEVYVLAPSSRKTSTEYRIALRDRQRIRSNDEKSVVEAVEVVEHGEP